jgi:hypothetical protein
MRSSFRRRPATAKAITGAVRSGIQGDLSALLDPVRSEKEDPRQDRPAAMIRSLRYVGATEGATPAEAMSAKSHALYEYLMASARKTLVDDTEHTVTFGDAMTFLSTPRTDRIREYLHALNSTYVSYDFTESDGTRRSAHRIQLLQCEEVVRPSGTREIGYRMHPSVRKVILAATQYTYLEIACFARFRCKYSARLYPLLAFEANKDETRLLRFAPEDLADALGYVSRKGGKFSFNHFESDCLRPAMDDMFGTDDTDPKVRRFIADYELERAVTRGRPVQDIVFRVTKAQKQLTEQRKPKVVSLDRDRVRKIFEHAGLDRSTEAPNEELLAQAAGRLGVSFETVARRWSATWKIAQDDPDLLVGSLELITGRQILDVVAAEGIGAAFEKWLVDWKDPKELRYRDGSKPGSKTSTAIAAADPVIAPLATSGVEFAAASIIQFDLDDTMSKQTIDDTVLTPFRRIDEWTGSEMKRIRIRWWIRGVPSFVDCWQHASEDDIAIIHRRFARFIDRVEYVA